MTAVRPHAAARSLAALLFPPILLAACSESPDTSTESREPASSAATDGQTPLVVELADCADIPFRDGAAYRNRLNNWALAYGRLCPVTGTAFANCTQLADATPAETLACIRTNARHDDDCPDEIRDLLLTILDDFELAAACGDLHRSLSLDAAIAATADIEGFPDDELPEDARDELARQCHEQHPSDPAAAARCVHSTAARIRAEIEQEREELAARQTLVDAFDASVAAADLDPPMNPATAAELRDHCIGGQPPPSGVGACADAALTALAAQRSALAALPSERARHAINHCVGNGFFVLRSPPIAASDCLREDAAAYAEITEHYAEHLDGCGGTRRRYSEIVDCTKTRWLTPERIAAAQAAVFDRHVPASEPERVRNAIDRACGRANRSSRFTKRSDSFLPGEHAGDIVARRIEPCVRARVAAFAAIRRFAGSTYAAAADRCIDDNYLPYNWWRAARCVHRAAERAGDAAFADALAPCLGKDSGNPSAFADCTGVPPR